MIKNKKLIPLIAAVVGGLIYRVRGGLPPSLPRPIDQLLFSLPYAYLTYTVSQNYWVAAFIWVLTTLAVIKGHGSHMDLGTWDKPRDDEWYEFTIAYLRGKIPEYWYDVIGISISGLTYTIPLGICYACYGQYWQGLAIGLSGLLKGPAYMIGWATPSTIPHFKQGTELGELFTGMLLWLVLGLFINGFFI